MKFQRELGKCWNVRSGYEIGLLIRLDNINYLSQSPYSEHKVIKKGSQYVNPNSI